MHPNAIRSIVSCVASIGSPIRLSLVRRACASIQGFCALTLLSLTLCCPPAHAQAPATLQVMGEDANGLPYLIAFQFSHSVWNKGFTTPLPTPITQPYNSFGLYPAPGNNLLDIGTDAQGNPYVITYQHLSKWYSGQRLPGPAGVTFSQMAASKAEGNTFQVVGLSNGAPYLVSWQDTSWHAGFSLPAPSGVTYSEIRAQQGEGNTLQVIGLGSDQNAYLISWQDTRGNWHAGFKLPSPTGVSFVDLEVTAASGNTLQIIGLDSSGNAYLVSSQDSSGNWHSGSRLPSPAGVMYSALAVSQSEGNTLQVVGLSKGNPYLISWQDGTWHSGFALRNPYGTTFISICTGHGTDGNLQVVGLDRSKRPFLIAWQAGSASIAGQWGTYGLLPSPIATSSVLVTGNSQ